MNLYNRIKPFHIQQDTVDGCSIASYVMVHNAIVKDKGLNLPLLTQDTFRSELPYISRAWYSKTNGRGIGIPIGDLKLSITSTLIYFKIDYVVEKIRVGKYTPDQLLQYFVDVEKSNDKYIILNWDAHYSPLGCSGKNLNAMVPEEMTEFRILNVDTLRQYKKKNDSNYKEIKFDYGEGETCLNLHSLYKRLKQQQRSFLVFRPYERKY